MKVLLVGAGGREHALAWKLTQSARLGELLIAPGNPGTAELGRNIAVAAEDVGDLVALARAEGVDLVVVGPEGPLASGLADALDVAGIPCFGPSQAATRIEASKAFAKALMDEAGIPTARHRVFDRPAEALRWLEGVDWREWRVVKADGLHAGKGVVVAEDEAELREAVSHLGIGGEPVVLEESLEGEEISLLAFCDGQHVAVMPPAQDHKRIGEGDRGPNTGGMGAYAPVPSAAPNLEMLAQTTIEPAISALAARGTPFVGVLFAGLMLTQDGPRVLEFNARWGDPEAQALLPLLDSDLLDIIEACLQGRLLSETVRWQPGAALGVVLAAAGYPGAPRRGDAITLPSTLQSAHVFHAGTALAGDRLVTAGGRVLTVVGLGADLLAARNHAYAVAEQIQFEGKQMRRDIGWRSLTAAGRGP